MDEGKSRQVYWAGDLFNFKDLIGNRILADRFNKLACGRWIARLPQDSESNSSRAENIRDDDLELLFTSDAVVANFDGTDLDSGTVVEFCFAKFLDLPTVLLRTDFRKNGDSAAETADPWNLMCSGYPRTLIHCLHSMKELHSKTLDCFLDDLALAIIEKLDLCTALPPVSTSPEEEISAFLRAVKCAGPSMAARFPEERIRYLVAEKHSLPFSF